MAERLVSMQRGWGVRLAAFALTMLVAACSTVVPPEATRPSRRPPPPRSASPSPAPLRVEQGIPRDVERDRIALLVPMTGPNAGIGKSLANATMMAQLDSKSERIRITTYDTNLGAAAAAQRALAEGAQLILGPLLAEDARIVGPIARAARVPVISFSNDITVAGEGVYVLGYSPAQSIQRLVDYAKGQGITNFAGMIPAGVYGQRVSTPFLRAVEASGGQVLSLQNYTQATLPAAAARLAKNTPYQAVLIADGGTAAAAIVPVLRTKGGAAGARILGTELWNAEASIATKPALNGAWFASVADELYRQYATRYRERFGAAPYRLSSMGYDAVLLTIRIAREWPAGTPFPEDRLHDRSGFAGLDGAFRFGRDDVAERALEVQEIRGGTTVTVSPAPTGFE